MTAYADPEDNAHTWSTSNAIDGTLVAPASPFPTHQPMYLSCPLQRNGGTDVLGSAVLSSGRRALVATAIHGRQSILSGELELLETGDQ